jgi:putative redox protein
MTLDEKEDMKEELQGYKNNIIPSMKAKVTWTRDLVFQATTPQGYELDFDADVQWGCKPTESLLMSLGGCMAIDIVSILKKMRMEVARFHIDISADRNPDPPQYFKAVEMVLHVAGKNLDPVRIERAIALSRDKYCSVYNSLRKDMALKVSCQIEDTDSSAA